MVRSQKEKVWLIGAALVAFVLLLVGWFMVIAPQRSQTSQVDGQVSSAQLENDTVQQRITALAAQSKKLSTYQQQLARAQLALPATSGLPDFLRTLQAIGNATATDVTSLSVGSPVGATTAPAATSAPATGTTTSAAPAPAATAPAAPAIWSLPITAQVSGGAPQLKAFLTQLQKVQPRAVLISQITYGTTGSAGGSAGGGRGQATMQLTMTAFVAPTTAAAPVTAGAAGTAPTPAAPTPTPTAGG